MMEAEVFVPCWPPYVNARGTTHQARLNLFCKSLRQEAKKERVRGSLRQKGWTQKCPVHVIAILHADDRFQPLDNLQKYAKAVRKAMVDAYLVDEEAQIQSVMIDTSDADATKARGCTVRMLFDDGNE